MENVKSLTQLEAVQALQGLLLFCGELVEQRNDCGEMSVLSARLSRSKLVLSDHRTRGGAAPCSMEFPTCTQPLPTEP